MNSPVVRRLFAQSALHTLQSLPSALTQALSQPNGEVKSAEALANLLKTELDTSGCAATDIANLLVSHSSSWKMLQNHPQVGDSLVEFVGGLGKKVRGKKFGELLLKGTLGTYRKVFRETQAARILTETCIPTVELPWRTITTASAFMKIQSFTDPYLLDQFTVRGLQPDAPINDLTDFLHTTWVTQPINFELEWLFRMRLQKEWKKVSDRLVLKAIITLLKSSVKGDMLTYLRLIRRIDARFVENLSQRELVMCLGVLAKCKSRQLDVDQMLFESVAQRCKGVLKSADSKMLFIIGQALSQVNFGEKDFFTLLKDSAFQQKEQIEYLDYLVQTTAPSVEAISW